MRVVTLFVFVSFAVGCAKQEPCVEMQEAIDEGAGAACSSSDDCVSIPCACADGSTINTSTCGNGVCGGLESCISACGEILAECTEGGAENNGGGGGSCCVYACESGGIEASGASSSPTDDSSCRTAAEEFCGDFSITCSTLASQSCGAVEQCGCSEIEDGTCP